MQLSVCFNYLHPTYESCDGMKVRADIDHEECEEVADTVRKSWCLNEYFDIIEPMIEPDKVLDFEDTPIILDMVDNLTSITNEKLIDTFNKELSFPCYLYLDAIEPVKIQGEECYTFKHPKDSKEYLQSLDHLIDDIIANLGKMYGEESLADFNELIFLVIVDIIPKDTATTYIFPDDY